MAINFKSFFRFSAGFALLLSSSMSFATGCYVESPNLEALGDDYYNLDLGQQLSRAEKKQAQQLFNALNGDWKGSSIQTDCRGPDSNPREVIKEYEATIEVRSHSDSVELKLARRDVEQRVTRNDRATLYEANELYAIEFTKDGTVIISNKARQPIQLKQAAPNNRNSAEYRSLKKRITELEKELNNANNTAEDTFNIKQRISQLTNKLAALGQTKSAQIKLLFGSSNDEFTSLDRRPSILKSVKELNKLNEDLKGMDLESKSYKEKLRKFTRLKKSLQSAIIERYKKINERSRILEKVATLSLKKNRLKLTFLQYNNGIFVAEESFELYR